MARLAASTASEIDKLDTSYLTQQVANIIAQLHGLFDEIGVGSQERDGRESDLFAALSDTLHNQVNHVAKERQSLVEDATRLASNIKQLTAALDDKSSYGRTQAELGFEVTYPLRDCVKAMNEKYNIAQKLHQDRFDQVKKLVIALHSYASHLEPSFVKVKLPPNLSDPKTAAKAVSNSCPPSFCLSATYISDLDTEFTRIYEEYHRRVSSVRAISHEIIDLWAELGTPDAQTDHRIVEHGNDTPEQLGLRSEDLQQLLNRRERLVAERTSREKKLAGTISTVKDLWERLGIDESERKTFLSAHRGIGLRTATAYDNEMARLNEVKRQNMGLFVEEARCRLQALWDELFFSEEDMLAFTPAWSDDVSSDALLASHESEISRLRNLAAQRKPILALISRHQTLISDRNELEASSQDASRLLLRGQKGERRDPGKLLREEKMRKRISKELPRIESELHDKLQTWKRENGKEFLVRGAPYIDELESSFTDTAPPNRGGAASSMGLSRPKSFLSMAPGSGGVGNQSTMFGMGTLRSAKSTNFSASTRPLPSTMGLQPPSRAKTPTLGGSRMGNMSMIQPPSTLRGHGRTQTAHEIGGMAGHRSATVSPSRLPARPALGTMRDTNTQNYPPRPMSTSPTRIGKPNTTMIGTMRSPPKMKDLFLPPSPSRLGLPVPSSHGRAGEPISNGGVIRSTAPEDVYEDRAPSRLRLQHYPIFTKPPQSAAMASAMAPSPLPDSSFSSQSNNSNSWQDRNDYLHTPRQPKSANSLNSRLEPTMMSIMSAPSAAAASAVAAAAGGVGGRQTSHSSNATSVSTCGSIGASALAGSENWETYGGDEDEHEPNHVSTYSTPRPKASPPLTPEDEEVSAYRRQQERYYSKIQAQRQQQPHHKSPERLHPAGKVSNQDVENLTSSMAATRLANTVGETY